LRDQGDFVIVHGRGYTRFTHTANEIHSQLLISIAPASSVKFVCLTLKNASRRQRDISIVYYAELVLGDSRERTQTEVWTDVHEATGSLLARNTSHEDFPEQVVFLRVLDRERTVTGDRREFLGRNRDFAFPAALERGALSGSVGAGLDPCGALQTRAS